MYWVPSQPLPQPHNSFFANFIDDQSNINPQKPKELAPHDH